MVNKISKPPFLPIPCDVEEGKTYFWCGCGKSRKQPFCDRQDCGDKCVPYRAILTETVYFCSCKQTKEPPLCDGSHTQLMLDYLKKRKKQL